MQRLVFILALSGVAHAAELKTGQPAGVVLGQPDFSTRGSSALAQPNKLQAPSAAAVDPATGKVFVADFLWHRVLRFSSAAARQNGANAETVFGQPNFTSVQANQGGAASAKSLYRPTDIVVDAKGTLWIVDQGNNRVLGFLLASSRTENSPADIILGQPDATTTSAGLAANKFSGPAGVGAGPGDVLWIVDQGNKRVLRFDSISSKTTGANADGVLGQPDFVTKNVATTANSLSLPEAVAIGPDGTLWVSEDSPRRVLRFDNARAKVNGASADGVLGQPDFTSNETPAGPAANNFAIPIGLAIDGSGILWVADFTYSRVLGFRNPKLHGNNSPADLVLGGNSFTSNMHGVSATALEGPMHIHSDVTSGLIVPDFNNQRILRFFPIVSPLPLPHVAVRGAKSFRTAAAKITLRGTSTNAARVEVKSGSQPYKRARGVARWHFIAHLKAGRNLIQVRATNADGETSRPVRIRILRQTPGV